MTLVSADQSNPEVKQKERIKSEVLTFQGRPCSLTVICRFDVQREVRRGRIRGPGGAARILSRRLPDTCGTKLSGNQVNESWRAGEATGLLVLQYSPVIISWTSARLPTAGRGRGGEGQWVAHQNRSKGFSNKRAKKTKHLLLMRHAWFLLRIHEYNLGHCLIFFSFFLF